MQVYKYHEDTKEFLGAEEAFLDPLESKLQSKDIYLLPANSTFTQPPISKLGHAVVWNGDEWIYMEDHRQSRDRGGVIIETSGTPFWLPGDTYLSQPRYLSELGPLPEDALLERPAKPQDVIDAEILAQAKSERAALVAKATVEVDGMVFDADETSQGRMSRTITAATTLGLGADETIEWTLADTSAANVTVKQLAQALYAAGQYQTSVWRKPYQSEE